MAAALAARFPDDLQAQRLLAQGLTIVGDFAAAARQWRRVVELEPDGLVARQNWVRALYEAGEPDQAVREARRVAGSPDAPPPMLELIAQDALARGDHAEAASWYRELTRRAPEKLLYWRTLGMTLDRLHLYDEQAAVAREALRHHPERLELQLDLVTALSSARRHGEATALARKILASFPDNRPAYETLVSQLSAAGKLSDALRELSRNHPSFYKEHERRMIEASLRARQNDFAAAARLLRSVADPPPGHHYVPVIVYHGLVPTERTLQTSVDEFEDQMAALAAHGYQAITLADYARMVDGELPVPARPILITFDDARSDSFRNGDPILAKYGLNATMFVPTSRIGEEDGFHVGWNTLARYARSGRWDLQAHGHEAHDPIVIDAAGHKGEFLAYRAWLPAERRSETDTEYVRRLDEDFGRCQRALAERFPDRPILGYAYPLNLLGQAQPGEHAGLPPRNVLLAQRFFRFGFVQDETGYNGFRQGAGAPFLVRRFEVPSGWSGADLVAHLARAHPAAAARLALARLTVDEGRPEAARRIVHEIVRREPLVAGETRRTLAQIAWDQDRTREAASHLAAAPPAQPGASPRRDPLRDQLRWRNAPRVGAEASAFGDSDRRSFLEAGVVLRYPLPLPVDVELRASEVHMTEPDMRDMTGLQVAGSVNAGIGERLDLGGWARHRQLSLVPGSLNGGAHLRLRREQHVFALRWAHEDVDTVPAQLLEIGSNVVSTSYEFRSPRWRAQWAVGHRTFDDGNARTDLSGAVLRLLGSGGRWGVGGNVALQDSRVDPAEYYAPRNLVQAVGRLTYRHAWTDSSSVSVDARLGGAHDPVNGLRPSGSAQFRFTRHWGQRRLIGTSLGVDARAVPGYQSLAGMLMIEGRL
jgi:peptidoglycan/xylan/chitin deacetylase (PgdA/CDA1 family)/predicted Zn-dependent protease